jgi:hypothetical protein
MVAISAGAREEPFSARHVRFGSQKRTYAPSASNVCFSPNSDRKSGHPPWIDLLETLPGKAMNFNRTHDRYGWRL